jgi:chorismate-pyruvate lyase
VAFLAQFGDFNARSLDLLQRVLLVCDGTLTDTLEAAFLEPIGLRKIADLFEPALSPIPELDLTAGEPLMKRHILLYGEKSGRTYVYAESLLVFNRLPTGLQEQLVQSQLPMGRLWSEHRLETWKELLGVWRRPMGELASYFEASKAADCLVRRYRVISGGRPLIAIAEHFPVTYRLDGK